jgi:hypothetical protein
VKYGVCLEGTIRASSDEDVESHLDQVMTELLELQAEDPSIDVALDERRVSLAVAVEASNPLEAIDRASSFIRAAIHAAGGATPDWPTADDGAWSIRLIGVRSGELVAAP